MKLLHFIFGLFFLHFLLLAMCGVYTHFSKILVDVYKSMLRAYTHYICFIRVLHGFFFWIFGWKMALKNSVFEAFFMVKNGFIFKSFLGIFEMFWCHGSLRYANMSKTALRSPENMVEIIRFWRIKPHRVGLTRTACWAKETRRSNRSLLEQND